MKRKAHWTNKMKRTAELKAKRPNIIPDTHRTVSENSVLEQLREAETPESRESEIQRRNESQRGGESLQLA